MVIEGHEVSALILTFDEQPRPRFSLIFYISQLMIKSVLKDMGHGLLMSFVDFTLKIHLPLMWSNQIPRRQIISNGYDDLNFIGAMAFSQLQNFSKRKKSLFKF